MIYIHETAQKMLGGQFYESWLPSLVFSTMQANEHGQYSLEQHKQAESIIRTMKKLGLLARAGTRWALSKQGKTLALLEAGEAAHAFLCRQSVIEGHGKKAFGLQKGKLSQYRESTFIADYCGCFGIHAANGCFDDVFESIVIEAAKKYSKHTVCPTYCASQVFDYVGFTMLARYKRIYEFIDLKAYFSGRGLVWFAKANDGDLSKKIFAK